MKSIRRNLTPAVLFTALVTLAGSAFALKPGPVVTLDDALMARLSRTAVQRALRKEGHGVSLRDGLSVDRKEAGYIWVNVPLTKDGASFTIKAAFSVSCILGGGITLSPSEVRYEANDFKSWIAQVFMKDFINETEMSLEDQLRSEVFATSGLSNSCPGIEVLSDGSIRLDYGPGDECTGGTKHLACPSTAKGSGRDYVCDNGRWMTKSYNCEFPLPDRPVQP
jgi:hypothetical protein